MIFQLLDFDTAKTTIGTYGSFKTLEKTAQMIASFLRNSFNFLTLACLASIGFVSQCQAQSQELPASGNSQVTEADAAIIFGTGAREIKFSGMLDLDTDAYTAGFFATTGGTNVVSTFPASEENGSTMSIELQNESGVVIGTFASSTLRQARFSTSQRDGVTSYEADFLFDDAMFTSTDGSTAGIVGDTLQVSVSDFDFSGTAGGSPPVGISPDELFAFISDGTFSLSNADVQLIFESGEDKFVENVKILQSDPNQDFSFSAAILLGDVNLDQTVDFSDISGFISILAADGFQEEADIDQNNLVNFDDIGPFIVILAGP